MTLLILSLAAAAYAAGGIAMKWADGFRNPGATAAVFALFILGSALQTWAMRYESLGVGYVVVLGLEAILAVAAGMLVFGETVPVRNGIGIALVVLGIWLLKSAPEIGS